MKNRANKTGGDVSYENFKHTGSAKLNFSESKNAYATKHTNIDDNASHENFLRTGSAKLTLNKSNAYDNFYKDNFSMASSKSSSSPTSIVKLDGQISGVKSLLVKATDKLVEGSKNYIKPKLVVGNIVLQTHSNTKTALKQGRDNSSAFVCGALGAVAKTTVSTIGNELVIGSTVASVGGSGGAALLIAPPMLALGFSAVGELSNQANQLTQNLCETTFDAFDSKRQPPSQLFFSQNTNQFSAVNSLAPALPRFPKPRYF